MPEFLHNEKLTDSERLKYFIDFVRDDVLEPVIKTGEDHKGEKIISTDVLTDFQRSWEELKKDQLFQNLRMEVGKISERSIVDHGLRGVGLQSKRNIIRIAWDRYQKSGGGALFRKLLGVLEPLFDSILDATGVGGAIKELKDMLAENVET